MIICHENKVYLETPHELIQPITDNCGSFVADQNQQSMIAHSSGEVQDPLDTENVSVCHTYTQGLVVATPQP